ncbi:uncharacterized protein [Fopius arisanus]|uniref:Uncharacterized protein isoform X1 n=1 Tax=Fopius arisanus TaxID=64838 RepID=A0A9R1TGZ7_9HYME|nr:PREDICTED: uncharacterized protein LOC105270801 isoform X1 [Fopius arisanus]
MHHTSAIYLWIIGPIIAVNIKHISKHSIESRLRNLFDRPNLSEYSVVRLGDNEQDVEDKTPHILENYPFERFKPADGETIITENIQTIKSNHKNIHQGSPNRRKKEKRGKKLKYHKFTIWLAVASLLITCIVMITCCSALFPQNQIIRCIHMIRSRKTLDKYLNIDSEAGRCRIRVKLKQQKPQSPAVTRARSLSYDCPLVAMQYSTTRIGNSDDTPSIQCYTCCKKKRKKGKRKKKLKDVPSLI